MAKQNIVILMARVKKPASIRKNAETGEYNFGLVYTDVVRGVRQVDDKVDFIKHDSPLIMSKEKAHIECMATWKENDIVLIKGVVTSKRIPKISICPNCTNPDGTPVKNETIGNLLYITPIFAEKIKSFNTKREAVEYIVDRSEMSNQVWIYGVLLKDPKLFTTKQKVQITQYPIAINRKFTIRTDDPTIKTDWPVVKSYGEQAREDRLHLKAGSEVIIDGFLQAREITRKTKCECCGQIYEWKDHAMEIVPYAVEYVADYLSNTEIEEEHRMSVEELKQMLYAEGHKDELEEGFVTTDLGNVND